MVNINRTRPVKFVSLWRKDICDLDKVRESNLDWFLEYAKKKIGNGVATFFLREPWLSIYRFATLFLDFFLCDALKELFYPNLIWVRYLCGV